MKSRRDLRLKKVLILGAAAGAIIGVLVTLLAARNTLKDKDEKYAAELAELEEKNKELQSRLSADNITEIAKVNAEVLASNEKDWSLVLVNESHPLDTSYSPELAEVEVERSVDKRILDDTMQMLQDASSEGLSLYVCSAHRSYEKQREVFNATMQDWINQGYGPLDAYDETKKSVAVPGTSEHATGLALDITSAQYGELDDEQANTAEAKWLAKNCWKYGFILRYPPEKGDVTGIVYEPWHYRYVGKEAAKEIMEQGITLEEYLQQ